MAETKLKLVKTRKNISKAADTKTRPAAQRVPPLTAVPSLSQAERAEAARFKALTAAKAARQAMLHRIMSELQELDESQPAA
ncbi:MAG: hypothetical protein HYR94_13105 [Chloroflexi bacterium]|nr:hypothetical protein [Chloroflexota bacterium]